MQVLWEIFQNIFRRNFHEISDHPNNEIVLLTKGTMVPESLTWYLMSKQEIDLSNGHIKL